MKSNGCESRTAKASEQAGSECCHSSGDWWVRSVHSKEAGREGSAPKSNDRGDADAVLPAEGSISERQNSRNYVHTNRQTNRTSQGGSKATILLDPPHDHARSVVCGIPR